jgi:hypothetical protein
MRHVPRAEFDKKFERWSAYLCAIVLSGMLIGAFVRVVLAAPKTSVWPVFVEGTLLDALAIWNALRLWRTVHKTNRVRSRSGPEDAV